MIRDLMAELVMGRVCYGPSLSWAEFVMGRDVPESSATMIRLQSFSKVCFCYSLSQKFVFVTV